MTLYVYIVDVVSEH